MSRYDGAPVMPFSRHDSQAATAVSMAALNTQPQVQDVQIHVQAQAPAENQNRSRLNRNTLTKVAVAWITWFLLVMILSAITNNILRNADEKYESNSTEIDFNFAKSFYFTVVTVSTVGYGDFSPQKDGTRFWVALLILFGSVSNAVFMLYGFELATKGEGPFWGYCCNSYKIRRFFMIFTAFVTTFCIFIFTVSAFEGIQQCSGDDHDHDTLKNSTWFAFITTSTVGYGDYHPCTDKGFIYVAIMILFNVPLYATLIGLTGEAMKRLIAYISGILEFYCCFLYVLCRCCFAKPV